MRMTRGKSRIILLILIFIESRILLFDLVMDNLFTNTMAIELGNKFPPNIGIRMLLLQEI